MSVEEQKVPSCQDLLGCGWEEVVSSASSPDCFYYTAGFAERAKSSEEAGDLARAVALHLLASVTEPRLKAEAGLEPYEDLQIVTALSVSELSSLDSFFESVTDSDLRARIGDVLFVREVAPYAMRVATVESFLRSAEKLFGDPHAGFWPYLFRVNRALAVAISLGRPHPKCDEVVRFIEAAIQSFADGLHSIVVLHLMRVLQHYKLGNSPGLAQLARGRGFALEAGGMLLEGGAEHFKAQGEYHEAELHWEVEARWWEIVGEPNLTWRAKLRAGASHILLARNWVTADPPNYINAWGQIDEAIVKFREIGGCKEIVDQLHVQLGNFGEKAPAEAIKVETPADFEPGREKAREAMTGKNWQDALATLVTIRHLPTKEELEEEIRNEAKSTPLLFLLASTQHGDKGRVTGKSPSAFSDDEKDRKTAWRNKLFVKAREHQIIDAEVLIDSARRQFAEDHDMSFEIFQTLTEASPFVPPGHEGLVARGLHAGLNGYFPVSAHLLGPQFEAGLRYLLFQRGVITTGYDRDGIQDEFSLNKLLQTPELAKELEAILGVETVFDLRTLLVERFGSNLRNRLAHGLLTEESAGLGDVKYLWWSILRLTLLELDPQAGTDGREIRSK